MCSVDSSIEHSGIVFDVVGNRVDVAIEAMEACASCRVKGACGMSESKQKNVSVVTPFADAYRVGEEVVVSVSKSMGMKAVLMAYVIPFFFLLAILLTMLGLGCGEVVSGLSALAAAVAWYTVVWLMRGRIEKEISFKIRKLQ